MPDAGAATAPGQLSADIMPGKAITFDEVESLAQIVSRLEKELCCLRKHIPLFSQLLNYMNVRVEADLNVVAEVLLSMLDHMQKHLYSCWRLLMDFYKSADGNESLPNSLGILENITKHMLCFKRRCEERVKLQHGRQPHGSPYARFLATELHYTNCEHAKVMVRRTTVSLIRLHSSHLIAGKFGLNRDCLTRQRDLLLSWEGRTPTDITAPEESKTNLGMDLPSPAGSLPSEECDARISLRRLTRQSAATAGGSGAASPGAGAAKSAAGVATSAADAATGSATSAESPATLAANAATGSTTSAASAATSAASAATSAASAATSAASAVTSTAGSISSSGYVSRQRGRNKKRSSPSSAALSPPRKKLRSSRALPSLDNAKSPDKILSNSKSLSKSAHSAPVLANNSSTSLSISKAKSSLTSKLCGTALSCKALVTDCKAFQNKASSLKLKTLPAKGSGEIKNGRTSAAKSRI
ncbi:cell wall protein AWA1-like [Hyalella azteca]|uniref:Cell wall protein AWA1-like n=1 Tax=Hyalella azteca TaxID=294128 RepID=A0A8B7NAU0_HYAAZ|nr:cell wall protein AWA1-like [Hyalella azteca]